MSMQFNTIIRTDPRCTGSDVCNGSIMSTDVIHFPFHRFKTRRLSLQSGQNDTLLFRSCHDIWSGTHPGIIKNQHPQNHKTTVQ